MWKNSKKFCEKKSFGITASCNFGMKNQQKFEKTAKKRYTKITSNLLENKFAGFYLFVACTWFFIENHQKSVKWHTFGYKKVCDLTISKNFMLFGVVNSPSRLISVKFYVSSNVQHRFLMRNPWFSLNPLHFRKKDSVFFNFHDSGGSYFALLDFFIKIMRFLERTEGVLRT